MFSNTDKIIFDDIAVMGQIISYVMLMRFDIFSLFTGLLTLARPDNTDEAGSKVTTLGFDCMIPASFFDKILEELLSFKWKVNELIACTRNVELRSNADP